MRVEHVLIPPSWRVRTVAGALVAGAVIANFLVMGRAVTFLNAGLIIAFLIWSARDAHAASGFRSVVPAYIVLLVLQIAHFCEELVFGFHHSFPAMFGYDWTDARFIGFNIVWLILFAAAAPGLMRRCPVALLAAWFLALAGGIGNGAFHIGMSAVTRAYFPGVATAPFMLAAGVVLVGRLLSRAPDAPAG